MITRLSVNPWAGFIFFLVGIDETSTEITKNTKINISTVQRFVLKYLQDSLNEESI